MRPEIAKGGVLRVRKHCRYAPERRFVRVLVKMTKNLGQWGGVRGSDPHIPTLGYTPGYHHGNTKCTKNFSGITPVFLAVSYVFLFLLN